MAAAAGRHLALRRGIHPHSSVLHYLWHAVDQHGVVLDIWCKTGGTAAPRSVSSSDCCMGSNTNRDALLPMVCAAMASLSERSSPMSGIGVL